MFKREQRSGSMIDKRFRRERTRSMVASRSMISAVDNEEGGVDPPANTVPQHKAHRNDKDEISTSVDGLDKKCMILENGPPGSKHDEPRKPAN
jgi:hypothetical protein